MPSYGKKNSKGVTKVNSDTNRATTPIAREKWASDDLAGKALKLETAKAKRRQTPSGSGKAGSFSPKSNKKFR